MRRKAYSMACQAYYIIFAFSYHQSVLRSLSPPRICFLSLLSFPKYKLPVSSLFINNSELVHLRQNAQSPWAKIASKPGLSLSLHTFSWTSVYTNQSFSWSSWVLSGGLVVCCFEFGCFICVIIGYLCI